MICCIHTRCHQLPAFGLTELPSELFHVTTVRNLSLTDNQLCSLPSEIALLTKLVMLNVRPSSPAPPLSDRFSGHQQPTLGAAGRTRSADQFEVALRANFETRVSLDRVLTLACASGERQPAHGSSGRNRAVGEPRVAEGAISATRDRSDPHSPQVSNNNLKWLPAEVCQLTALTSLWVHAHSIGLAAADCVLDSSSACRKSTSNDCWVGV
jgi:hypothetical protein